MKSAVPKAPESWSARRILAVGFGKHTLFNQTVRKVFNDRSLGCLKSYWEDLEELDSGLQIPRVKGQHYWDHPDTQDAVLGHPHAARIVQSCLEEIWAGASVVLIEDSLGKVRSTILAKVVARLSDAMLGPSWAACPCVFDKRNDGVDNLYECRRWVLGSASGDERDFERNYLNTQKFRRFHLSQLSGHAWVEEVQAHLESWAGKSAVTSAGLLKSSVWAKKKQAPSATSAVREGAAGSAPSGVAPAAAQAAEAAAGAEQSAVKADSGAAATDPGAAAAQTPAPPAGGASAVAADLGGAVSRAAAQAPPPVVPPAGGAMAAGAAQSAVAAEGLGSGTAASSGAAAAQARPAPQGPVGVGAAAAPAPSSAVVQLLARLRQKLGDSPAYYEAIASRQPTAPLLRDLCALHTQHSGVLLTSLDMWMNMPERRLSHLHTMVNKDLKFQREQRASTRPHWSERRFTHGDRPRVWIP